MKHAATVIVTTYKTTAFPVALGVLVGYLIFRVL